MMQNNAHLSRESRGLLSKVCAIAAMSIIVLSCSDARYLSESSITSRYRERYRLNQVARFLAGMQVDASSPYYATTISESYQRYRRQIDELWERYRSRNLSAIETWRRVNIKERGDGVVIYPFSGPDILNAVVFFPNAEEYVMIGLEDPGTVPDPLAFQPYAIHNELQKVRHALRTILQLNLFRTAEMYFDMRPESLSSITGIMMFFLARMEYDILSVRPVYIDGKGTLSAVPMSDPDAKGVEVVFRRGKGAPVQTARFFSVDLSDSSLSRKRGVASFLAARKGFVTFIKSASYLLSYDNFRICRSYLLAGSRFILQEDSGIPYRFFAPGEWRISLYGTYRVLPIFANRFQRDLNDALKQDGRGPIPFSFGYGFSPNNSNLMAAERIPPKRYD